RFIHQQTIAIETQPGADRDVAEPDQILGVGGLFAVLRTAVEPIQWRRVTIEDADTIQSIGNNVVAKRFTQTGETRFPTRFPLVPPPVSGQAAVHICLAKP